MPAQQLPEWAVALGAEPSRYQAFLRRRGQGGMPPAGGDDMRAMPVPAGAGGDAVARPVPDGERPGRRLGQGAERPGRRLGQQRRMSDTEMQRGLDDRSLPVRDAVAQLDARRPGRTPPAMPPAAAGGSLPARPALSGPTPLWTDSGSRVEMPMFGIGAPSASAMPVPPSLGLGSQTAFGPVTIPPGASAPPDLQAIVPDQGLQTGAPSAPWNPMMQGNPDAIAALLRARMAGGVA